MNRVLARQLGLPFPHAQHYTEAEFLAAGSNEAGMSWLGRTEAWPERRLALWGDAGVGKTHLLHVWAQRSGAVVWQAGSLQGLAVLPGRGIALDDADTCGDETALLHLLNAMAEAGHPMLLAGRTAPARWPVRLADLRSRLRAMTSVQVREPDDAHAAVHAGISDDDDPGHHRAGPTASGGAHLPAHRRCAGDRSDRHRTRDRNVTP